MVTFTILSGSQFVSFYNSGIKMGRTATATAKTIGGLSIVPGGTPPDSAGDRIVILAQSGPVTAKDSILLEPPYLDHFGAYVYPYAQYDQVIPVFLVPQNYYNQQISIPDTTRVDVSLDSAGAEYGNLYIGSEQVKSLSNVRWDSLESYGFGYVADGKESSQPTNIDVKVTVPGSNTKPKDIPIQVSPAPVVVTVTPSVLSPGDTATITLKQRNADDSLSNFPPNRQFEIGLWSGEGNGAILLPNGTTKEYFSDVTQPFRFIASDSIGGDSAVVLIRAGTSAPIPTSTKKDTNVSRGEEMSASRAAAPRGVQKQVSSVSGVDESTPADESDFPVTSPNYFSWLDFGIGRVVIKQQNTILLGQTKYYEALVDKNDPSKLDIQRIGDPWKADPDRAHADFTVQPKTGDKLGVYWEKMDSTGTPLQFGLIRLVGRYWQIDSTYEVTLTATTSTAKGSINIEVKKPSKLGEAPNTAYDVHDSSYALDDSIITYAGRFGVLPQYIKAMIRNETSNRFAPSYRYEPFLDMQVVQRKNAEGHFTFEPVTTYWITGPGELGKPGIPKDHTYLYNTLGRINGYPGYETVWEIYNSDRQEPKRMYSLSVYGNIYGLKTKWKEFYNYARTNLHYSPSEASQSAENQYVTFLKNDWDGGMVNTIAQTRISASYGLLQLVYYYGVTDGEYPIDGSHRPEDINLVSNSLYYGTRHFVHKLAESLSVPFNSNNWPDGLEKSYLNGLRRYNPKPDYAPDVVNNSERYKPQL